MLPPAVSSPITEPDRVLGRFNAPSRASGAPYRARSLAAGPGAPPDKAEEPVRIGDR